MWKGQLRINKREYSQIINVKKEINCTIQISKHRKQNISKLTHYLSEKQVINFQTSSNSSESKIKSQKNQQCNI